MKVAIFSARSYERPFFEAANRDHGFSLRWLEPRLESETARLAGDVDAISVFVHDVVDRSVITQLADAGVHLIALRCAGFNNVDLQAARMRDITVARVPAYSPYAVAEHAVGLMLALNRKLHRAHQRVREGNFALGGLLGFDMHGRTVGIVGTGRIGQVVARILAGFGCSLLGYDVLASEVGRELGVEYVSLDRLFAESDIVTLHCPLTPETHHLIDEEALEKMRDGVMIVNTSRGGLLDSRAAIRGLKSGQIGSLGLDVYEEEADLFYEDLSDQVIHDDVFARLLTFPNVLITAHQAFFTREALSGIAEITLRNVADFRAGRVSRENLVSPELVKPSTNRTRKRSEFPEGTVV